MRRFRADVRTVTGRTIHRLGTKVPDGTLDGEILHDPIAVEIVEEDDAFYLLRLNANGECIADTWHQTLEEAKAQGLF